MVKPIIDASSRRWLHDQVYLAGNQPQLRLVNSAVSKARIEGPIRLDRPDGRVVSFEISILYPSLDPFHLPDTYDLVNQLPREEDRHIESSGRFCLWLPQTAPVDEFQRPGGLCLYVARLQEFLALQLMYDARKKHNIVPHWAGEEWEHGSEGHRQWFRETAGDLNSKQFEALLKATREATNPGYRCPCGSGKRLGNCHKRWIKQMRRTVASHPYVIQIAYSYLHELKENWKGGQK